MSNGVLSQASHEWATRPADESYPSLAALHAAAVASRERSGEAPGVALGSLRVTADNGKLRLIGQTGQPASLTHWSFGQLARTVDAPAAYLRDLPANLAAENLNHGLSRIGSQADTCKLLLDAPQDSTALTVRAFTSDGYARIWDADITSRLMRLTAQDARWQPAPETKLPGGGTTRALYKSDHNVFAMLVDNDRRVFESLPGGGLSRGIIVANSETGDQAFWLLTFLYSYICANHNVWGVEGATELRIRHVGSASSRAFANLSMELRRYSEGSATDDEAKIKRCMAHQIGATKDEVLDRLFGLKSIDLPRRTLIAAYDAAEMHSDWYGSPRSAWGIGNGITEVARAIPHADVRVKTERAARRVFEMAF